MEIPTVTVLMPVFNGERYLRDAIESILNQTYNNFEFLIINDGSTDKSKDIILSYNDKRINFIENELNTGLIETLNKGIMLARGKYIVRMDCDDISALNRIEKQIDFMEKYNDIVLCGTWIKTISINKEEIWKVPGDNDTIKCLMLFRTVLFHPTIIFRKDIFIENNYFYDLSFIHAEDFELWTRVIQKYKVSNIQEVLLYYRIHSNNISNKYSDIQLGNTKKIFNIQLQKLNLFPTVRELEIHKLIGSSDSCDNAGVVKEIEFWLLKLINANYTYKVYPNVQFLKIIKQKWLNFCSNDKMSICIIFIFSDLNNYMKFDMKTKVLILFKSLFATVKRIWIFFIKTLKKVIKYLLKLI